jgi:signal transduction histidine kinase
MDRWQIGTLQSGTGSAALEKNGNAPVRSLAHERKGEAMEAQSTPHASPTRNQLPDEFLTDHGELRSVLSNLSHELCRPLTSMKAGFDLLLGDDAPFPITHDQRGHLLIMVSLCDDLLRLTHSYLDYAGVVQGSRTLCLGSFTIGALIGEIDRQFAATAATRRIEWEARAHHPETLVVTDASRCQQVFGNLVSNALKYTPAGGQVRVIGKLEADSWIVSVSDSGPGIPGESLEKVFAPFVRLPRDEHSGIEGNGLGLAICRELVAQLSGEIALESAVGHGTTATVRFPVAHRSPLAEVSVASATGIHRSGPP